MPCFLWAWRAAMAALLKKQNPHRPRRFGVVTGGSRRNEGVPRFAGHHLVDRMHDAADSAQRRLETSRRHGRVGVEPDQTFLGGRLPDGGDVAHGMAERDRVERSARRFDPGEGLEALAFERAVDGAQPIRSLRMAGRREVLEAGGVSDEKSGHQPIRKWRSKDT